MSRPNNREHLLAKGLELIYERGFHAVGVQDIADASGLPKGSFYNYFKSKDDLGIQALQRYADQVCEVFGRTLEKEGGSPLSRLRGLYRRLTKHFEERGCREGCFAGNMCQELADSSDSFRAASQSAFLRMQALFTACLRQAQEAGELSPREDPEVLGRFLFDAWQGALLRMKATQSIAPLKQFQTVVFSKLLR